MSIWILLYDLFALIYVIWIPAQMVGRTLYPDEAYPVRTGWGLLLVVTLLPVACLLLSVGLETAISAVMIYTLATVVTLLGAAIQVKRFHQRTQRLDA